MIVISIMRVNTKKKREYVGLEIDPDVKERLIELANKDHRTLSQFLRIQLEKLAHNHDHSSLQTDSRSANA
jgi:predicted transcriptional regulator